MDVGGGYELWVGDLNHQIKSDQKRGLVDVAFFMLTVLTYCNALVYRESVCEVCVLIHTQNETTSLDCIKNIFSFYLIHIILV